MPTNESNFIAMQHDVLSSLLQNNPENDDENALENVAPALAEEELQMSVTEEDPFPIPFPVSSTVQQPSQEPEEHKPNIAFIRRMSHSSIGDLDNLIPVSVDVETSPTLDQASTSRIDANTASNAVSSHAPGKTL